MGAALSVRDLRLSVGSFALRGVSLDITPGSCCVLMGPTGSGKSLFMESICGLRQPHAGSVHIGGREVTRLDPAKRNLGYVPQDYALLPFQTVRQNIGFGLLARGVPTREREARIDEMLALLRIEKLAERLPTRLSGGERQRVALGRALIGRPELLLLDEPLSALDEETSDDLMCEMLRLREAFSITTIHICHVLEEALRLGDTLALMRDGRIIQTGCPEDLFARPRDLFVAKMLRLPSVLSGVVREHNGAHGFLFDGRVLAQTTLPEGPAHAVIDPERITLGRNGAHAGQEALTFKATIQPNPVAQVRPGIRLGAPLDFTVPGYYPPSAWPPGAEVWVSFPAEAVCVIPGGECGRDTDVL